MGIGLGMGHREASVQLRKKIASCNAKKYLKIPTTVSTYDPRNPRPFPESKILNSDQGEDLRDTPQTEKLFPPKFECIERYFPSLVETFEAQIRDA